MVKYPVQSTIGGTLLLGLAFSLNDGSSAQTQKSTALATCQNRVEFGTTRGEILLEDHCFELEAKK
jgi:hypothetical protein